MLIINDEINEIMNDETEAHGLTIVDDVEDIKYIEQQYRDENKIAYNYKNDLLIWDNQMYISKH